MGCNKIFRRVGHAVVGRLNAAVTCPGITAVFERSWTVLGDMYTVPVS